MCLPNENITELLEFCYIYPSTLIQEGKYYVVWDAEHTSFVNVLEKLWKTTPKLMFRQFRLYFWHNININLKIGITLDKCFFLNIVFTSCNSYTLENNAFKYVFQSK